MHDLTSTSFALSHQVYDGFLLTPAVGVVEMDKVTLLELEDVAKRYRHPSIIDIKLGFRTWYPTADQRYIDKCKAKDASTTQAALGFKICGMQVQLLVHVLLRSGSACVLFVTGCISEEPTC